VEITARWSASRQGVKGPTYEKELDEEVVTAAAAAAAATCLSDTMVSVCQM